MSHESPLIALLAVGFGLAFVFGAIAARLKLSPLLGYLLAGVLIGPFTPGFVADEGLAQEVADVGVILLMFGVGLHFSPRDLMAVRAVAVPMTLLTIATTIGLSVGASILLGWDIEAGIVFGLSLSVASTVVSLRNLQDRKVIQTDRGKLTAAGLALTAYIPSGHFVVSASGCPVSSRDLRLEMSDGQPSETASMSFDFGRSISCVSVSLTELGICSSS